MSWSGEAMPGMTSACCRPGPSAFQPVRDGPAASAEYTPSDGALGSQGTSLGARPKTWRTP
jgi:hypothetical protein